MTDICVEDGLRKCASDSAFLAPLQSTLPFPDIYLGGFNMPGNEKLEGETDKVPDLMHPIIYSGERIINKDEILND